MADIIGAIRQIVKPMTKKEPVKTMAQEIMAHDSKQAILDAAEEIIALHGYAGLSMRELSRQSGLAKSTLYHYFQDKSDIYISVLKRDIRSAGERIAAAAQREGDVAERLRWVSLAYFDMLMERGMVALNVLRRTRELDNPQLATLYHQHEEMVVAPIVAIVREGIELGRFRPFDPETAVINLLGMMNIYLGRRMLSKLGLVQIDELEHHHIIDQIMDLFLHGICQPTNTPAHRAEEDGVVL